MTNIDNLFKIMAEKRVSQKELAVAINASTGNVSDWKKGRSFPSAQKLDEAANFLKCSVDYLLGRTDNPNSCNGDCITIGDIDGNYNMTVGKGETKPLKIDGLSKEMLEKFECLDFDKKIEVMTLISNLSKK